MPRRLTFALALASVLSLAIAGVAVWSARRTISDLRNHRVQWVPAGIADTAVTRMPEGCRSLTVHGVSREHAILTSTLVPGGLLISVAAFGLGIARSRTELLWIAAGLMTAETFVVFTIFPLTFLAAAMYVYLARTKITASSL